jgi:hypothetical protein
MLLPPDQYYRPTQARELRRQSARLQGWANGLRACREVGTLVFAGGWFLLTLLVLSGAPIEGAALLIIGAVIGSCLLASIGILCEAIVVPPLERRVLRFEHEAEAMEREHQARYGTEPQLEHGASPLR